MYPTFYYYKSNRPPNFVCEYMQIWVNVCNIKNGLPFNRVRHVEFYCFFYKEEISGGTIHQNWSIQMGVLKVWWPYDGASVREGSVGGIGRKPLNPFSIFSLLFQQTSTKLWWVRFKITRFLVWLSPLTSGLASMCLSLYKNFQDWAQQLFVNSSGWVFILFLVNPDASLLRRQKK